MPAYGPKSSVLEHQPKGVIMWKGEMPSNKYPSSSMFVFYVWRVYMDNFKKVVYASLL